VQGYGVNSNFQVVQSTLQNITIPPKNLATLAQATQNASLSGTLNAGGVVATQGTVFDSQPLQVIGGGAITANTALTSIQALGSTATTGMYSAGQVLTLNAQQGGRDLPTQTLTISNTTTVGDLENFYQSGLAIDPSAPTGTPGVTIGSVDSAGDQGIVITGNVGASNALTIPTGGLTDNGGVDPMGITPTNQAANGESTSTPITVYDSVGNPVTLDVSTVLVGKSNAGTTWNFTVTSPQNESGTPVLSTGTLAFDTTGQLTSVDGVAGATTGTVTLNRTGTGATAAQQISLDFSGVQALSGATSNLVSPSQDGFAFGTFSSYSIGADGTITASYSNGLTKTVGQVALATFADPDGLINNGNNQYSAGAASGNAVITAPQAQGAGEIQSSSLEMSNVDLSKEFINLIIASTGYSASSRVISTSDQLLTDLLNSQR
jgi:flagellar hook protein FlgE